MYICLFKVQIWDLLILHHLLWPHWLLWPVQRVYTVNSAIHTKVKGHMKSRMWELSSRICRHIKGSALPGTEWVFLRNQLLFPLMPDTFNPLLFNSHSSLHQVDCCLCLEIGRFKLMDLLHKLRTPLSKIPNHMTFSTFPFTYFLQR